MLVGQKIGPFLVEKEIGAGAMGAVYRARHDETGQHVAIKVVSPNLAANETAMLRFKRESAILKQLKHPNIVKLVATGKFNGMPFYAMEYVEGESLDRVMARRDRISWEHLVTLGQQLCAALQHAHNQGIVHRDLKPSNIMVLPDDTVKLTDFGIAKDLDVTALTEANCTVGTASYMSPEQCKGERDLTHKSDLYSMGVMFFELLTGRKPLIADSPMDMFLKHVKVKPPRVAQFVDVPPWLDTLIDQLLAKKPEHRPLNAAAVGEALGRVQEKVEARQSAGVEAARSRVGDRLPEQKALSDEDKEAARALLRKKKKKEEQVPFYRQGWFQVVGLVTLLLFVGVVFYLVFLRRPDADDLYKRAKRLIDSNDTELWKDAREGPIKDYLAYYGDQDNEKTQRVKAWADQVDARLLEDHLMVRLGKEEKVGLDADEKIFRQGVKDENDGKLADARSLWNKLVKNKDSSDEDKRKFALVAQERLARLDRVDELEKTLADPKHKPADERETIAVEALRWEKNKDKDKNKNARKLWEKLIPEEQSERDDPKTRKWFLLAKKHLLALPTKSSRRPDAVPWFAAPAALVLTDPDVWRRTPCPPHHPVSAAGRRSPAPVT